MNDQNNNPDSPETQAGPQNTGDDASRPNGHEGHGHGHDHGAGDGHGHGDGHHHHHGHDHNDPLHPHIGAPLDENELDPANRSLADALRVSFAVLKVVMIFLLIAFLFSGTRNVDEGSVAVPLVFGAVAGDPGEQIKEPGGPYFWPPEPIGRFITVPTNQRTVSVDEAFWFFVPPEQQGQPLDQLRPRPNLVPGQDGSLLTGDKNVVHGRWSVNYRITKEDAPRFVRNVGRGDESAAERASRLVRFAAEQAILHAVAGVSADDFVLANINRGAIRSDIQQRLRELNAGITVEQVLLNESTPPLNVRSAFQLVNDAVNEKASMIDQARTYESRVLNEVAGSAHDKLIRAIDAYERARRRGDDTAIAKADDRITKLLDVEAAQGQVSELLREAQLYKRSIVSNIRAEADQFRSLMPQYASNPGIVVDRLWQNAKQDILSGEVETFYLPAQDNKELWLEINRDPRIKDRRERQQFIQSREQQRQEAERRAATQPTRPDGPGGGPGGPPRGGP